MREGSNVYKNIYFYFYCYYEIRTQYLKSRVKFDKCKLKISRLNLYSMYATVMNTCHILQTSCLLLGHELHQTILYVVTLAKCTVLTKINHQVKHFTKHLFSTTADKCTWSNSLTSLYIII